MTIREHLYKLFNGSVALIPRPILSRLLRALHRRPEIADRVGYQVYPQIFYSPFPNPSEVDRERLKLKRDLPGIKLDTGAALRLLAELMRYKSEVDEFLKNRPGNIKWWNNTYPIADTGTLYAMLRHLKPRRYIEVGCGYSSRVSAAALKRNETEGRACKALYIEPYPPPYLAEMQLRGEFLKEKIERVPLPRFQELEAGDVLFIDTSHVIKAQNDVEHELLRVLPTLKPGVIVHVHDIMTPYDYPAEWLVGTGPNRGGANEQYALECLMSGGGDWEVVLPVHLLWREHRAELEKLVASEDRPAAFWIRKAQGKP